MHGMKKGYTLKYNKYNADIRTRMEEIYHIWDKVSKELARNTLRKMHRGEFNELTKVSDKRLILYNLIRIEIEIDDVTNSAKQWSKELLDFLNNEPEYIEINLEEYAKALDIYSYIYEKELNIDEKIKIHELYYNAFKDYEYIEGSDDNDIRKYLDKMNAKFNINLLQKKFNILFEIFKEVLIHNNNTDCADMLNNFLKDVQGINLGLHNKMLLLLQNDHILQKIC